MRTTLTLDDDLLERARKLSGIRAKKALIEAGLEALISLESSRRLARLGGSERSFRRVYRRRRRSAP